MVFVAALVAWVGGSALVLFGSIKYTLGLRINTVMEEVRRACRACGIVSM